MKINILITGLSLLLTYHAGIAQKQDTALTIEEAVNLGLKNNLKVLSAQKKVAAAKGRAITTLGIENPKVSGEWEEIPAGSNIGSFGERTFRISQSIDFPTNYIHKKKLGDLDVQRAQAQLEKTRLEIRTEVEKAYYRLLARRRQLSLVKRHIQLAEVFLKKAQLRHNAGEAPVLEVSRAELALAEIENELSVAKGNVQTAKETLNALLALPDDRNAVATDSLTYQLLNLNLSNLKKQALQEHPDILTGELTQKMARQDLSLAKGSYLPDIEGSYFFQKLGGNQFRGVEVGLSIPLWAPLNQRGEVMQSKGNLQAAQYRLQDETIILNANIESAWSQYIAAREQVGKYLDNLLDQAQNVYDMTLRSYEEGKIDYLKVLDAQESLIMINRKYTDALASYKTAVAELEKTTNQYIDQ